MTGVSFIVKRNMGAVHLNMDWKRLTKYIWPLLALVVGMGYVGNRRAEALPQTAARPVPPTPQVYIPATNIPDDVQLLNADSNPTLRMPVGHSSLNWTLVMPRIRASYGWLEIDRNQVRYTMVRPSRMAKEPDMAFEISRAEITAITFEFNAAEFRARKLRHFFGYSPQNHWDAADSKDASVNSVNKTDALYTPLILRALQNFDGVVADLKLKQQAAAPPPAVVQPTVAPPPKPPAPSPPTLVLMVPSGADENQTVEVHESSLTIRGAAMDNSGLPTVAINGSPAALRPKGENAAEFWSDPITLKPGDNAFEIVATSPGKANAYFRFVAHFTPKAAPANPRALGKDEIISLLQGGVPVTHVTELVADRGIKFTPTSADLNDIRAAGANDELIQTILRAATPGK